MSQPNRAPGNNNAGCVWWWWIAIIIILILIIWWIWGWGNRSMNPAPTRTPVAQPVPERSVAPAKAPTH